MNGWPARSAASRKPHPKHTHPGRGAFCAPAVFAAGEMRLNGSKRRGQRARYHAKLRLPWPRARTPALVGFRLRFASQKRAAGRWPHRGQRARYHAKLRLPWPRGQNPGARRLPPPFCFAKTRGRSSAPPGPMFWPTTLSLRSSVAPRPKPRRSSASASVLLRKNARPVIGPAGADVLAYHAFASLKRGPAAKTPALDILPGHAIILISSK